MVAAGDDVENVAERGGLSRSYDADPCGEGWDRLFASRVEQSFGFELALELFESELQRARALGFDVLGGDLQLASIFVNRDASAHDDLQAIRGTKAQQPCRGAEHDYANLSVAVFEGEVKMSGVGSAKVRNFAFHPGVVIFAFDVRADGADQVTDFPDPPLEGVEAESHLVGKR